MSTEKRLVLWLVLSLAAMVGSQYLLGWLGFLPAKPAARPAGAMAKNEPQAPRPDREKSDSKEAKEAAKPEPEVASQAPSPAQPVVTVVPKEELVLGAPKSGYRLELQISQRGAGVASLRSPIYEAEHLEGQPRHQPLQLIGADRSGSLSTPPSFALNLSRVRDDRQAPSDEVAGEPSIDALPITLESVLWEVVRDDQGRVVVPVTKTHPTTRSSVPGERVTLRTTTEGDKPVTVTRTYTLYQGEDGFEVTLAFSSPSDQRVAYELLGPHGIPIEGEWYTATFRDVFFGGVSGTGTKVSTLTAADVVKHQDNPERFTILPLRFAGVENQYFAVFLEPDPVPATLDDSAIVEVRPVVIRQIPSEPQKSDVSIELISRPLELGPNRNIVHRYQVFAGPKTRDALAGYQAVELSSYRKGWSLPGTTFIAQNVIAPMLDRIYAVTKWISGLFGGSRGSYGIAIILLTMTVRLILFPLGRKQAKAAQKMQQLQPLMAELKAKHGDNKEALTRDTLALYREHGVNPMGGCLPALIQLPVLIGLWQALNNSVALRHSQFLWIDNLAAPDMLFKFPFPIPIVGGFLGPYFNVLPLVVVGLMLIQTKLFAPPPTTPEAEMQQKMMKFMMIFMMFMFYKVPSGLGIYFITSSLWQIGERLLLPKSTLQPPMPAGALEESEGKSSGKSRAANASAEGGGGWLSRLQDKAQQVLEEAEKQRTVRNTDDRRDRGKDRMRTRPGRK